MKEQPGDLVARGDCDYYAERGAGVCRTGLYRYLFIIKHTFVKSIANSLQHTSTNSLGITKRLDCVRSTDRVEYFWVT